MSATTTTTDADDQFLLDVLDGLSKSNKTLPCKYFYDERGSQLFDQICELDEYYLTRAELEIMELYADEMAEQLDEEVMLVEYGSGSSTKTRILLDALKNPSAYVPVDISEEHLLKTADRLKKSYPHIEILPIIADFVKPFDLPRSQKPASHVAVYFPGSTIGNFTLSGAGDLLQNMARRIGKDGGLLIGIDLQKDKSVLEAAYDDSKGVTAEFNLNILHRIQNELGGELELEQFEHRAVYDENRHRIQTTIVSTESQQLSIGDETFNFDRGEEIVTEYSHKYTIEGFAELANQFGFALHKSWTDSQNRFAVLHLVLEDQQ